MDAGDVTGLPVGLCVGALTTDPLREAKMGEKATKRENHAEECRA